mmetsp:Transcript_10503/g.27168  ORF Transcript_10503/g.27168 Transcript_10503/m.27168 type:complete len:378 (+) Transcript_10503:2030-3163(+)
MPTRVVLRTMVRRHTAGTPGNTVKRSCTLSSVSGSTMSTTSVCAPAGFRAPSTGRPETEGTMPATMRWRRYTSGSRREPSLRKQTSRLGVRKSPTPNSENSYCLEHFSPWRPPFGSSTWAAGSGRTPWQGPTVFSMLDSASSFRMASALASKGSSSSPRPSSCLFHLCLSRHVMFSTRDMYQSRPRSFILCPMCVESAQSWRESAAWSLTSRSSSPVEYETPAGAGSKVRAGSLSLRYVRSAPVPTQWPKWSFSRQPLLSTQKEYCASPARRWNVSTRSSKCTMTISLPYSSYSTAIAPCGPLRGIRGLSPSSRYLWFAPRPRLPALRAVPRAPLAMPLRREASPECCRTNARVGSGASSSSLSSSTFARPATFWNE